MTIEELLRGIVQYALLAVQKNVNFLFGSVEVVVYFSLDEFGETLRVVNEPGDLMRLVHYVLAKFGNMQCLATRRDYMIWFDPRL